jgi:hypothetical protein
VFFCLLVLHLPTCIGNEVPWLLDEGGSMVGLGAKEWNQVLFSLYPTSLLKSCVFCYFVGFIDDVRMVGLNIGYDLWSVEVDAMFFSAECLVTTHCQFPSLVSLICFKILVDMWWVIWPVFVLPHLLRTTWWSVNFSSSLLINHMVTEVFFINHSFSLTTWLHPIGYHPAHSSSHGFTCDTLPKVRAVWELPKHLPKALAVNVAMGRFTETLENLNPA